MILKSIENYGFFVNAKTKREAGESEIRNEKRRRRRRDEKGQGSAFPVGGGCCGAAGGALGSRFPAQMAEGAGEKEVM